MKSKEEIEQLANEYAKQFDYAEDSSPFLDYIEGYTQCQEDMANKKYTEEDMLNCWNTAFIDAMNIDSETYKPIIYSDFINSLNKQDLPIINGSYGCTIETSKNKQD
jgi:hypothetical protein